MISIIIKDDYTDIPGGRFKREGAYSGEEFRDNILLKRFEEAVSNNEKLLINFDGCFGFGTSFLEEAFGGLVRVYDKRNVWETLKLVSNEDETIPGLVEKYIKDAEREKGWR